MKEGKKRVFVALSGGVDSAVTALLLKQKGYVVTGVFIKIWQPEFTECTWKEDRLDAIRVAVALGIPFREVDFSGEYKRHVIRDMLDGYASGITPNPDVLCNRHIKFGALWEWAKENGADLLATGHHARVRENENGSYDLLRGVDDEKDQSYFLWQLTQEDLMHLLMPVGEISKREVRALATKHALPVAKKRDSQGLCFVGDVAMQDFLKTLLKTKKGKVISENGTEIGEHNGAALYTIGQRHGFRIFKKGTDDTPYYILNIDVASNTITVTKEKRNLHKETATLAVIHWINGDPSTSSFFCQVRYRQKPQRCRIESQREGLLVHFDTPQIATPGQSLVFYDADRAIGGGVIVSS